MVLSFLPYQKVFDLELFYEKLKRLCWYEPKLSSLRVVHRVLVEICLLIFGGDLDICYVWGYGPFMTYKRVIVFVLFFCQKSADGLEILVDFNIVWVSQLTK
jgi:hypothetical protein